MAMIILKKKKLNRHKFIAQVAIKYVQHAINTTPSNCSHLGRLYNLHTVEFCLQVHGLALGKWTTSVIYHSVRENLRAHAHLIFLSNNKRHPYRIFSNTS